MADDDDPAGGRPPEYTRYRARPRLRPRAGAADERAQRGQPPAPGQRERLGLPRRRSPGRTEFEPAAGWRRWTTPRRIALLLVGFVVCWLALSVLLFLI